MLPATGAKTSRAQAPQTLATQGFPANAEKVQKPAFTAAKMGQDQAGIMGRIKRMGVWFPRSKWAKWAKWAKMGQGVPLVPYY